MGEFDFIDESLKPSPSFPAKIIPKAKNNLKSIGNDSVLSYTSERNSTTKSQSPSCNSNGTSIATNNNAVRRQRRRLPFGPSIVKDPINNDGLGSKSKVDKKINIYGKESTKPIIGKKHYVCGGVNLNYQEPEGKESNIHQVDTEGTPKNFGTPLSSPSLSVKNSLIGTPEIDPNLKTCSEKKFQMPEFSSQKALYTKVKPPNGSVSSVSSCSGNSPASSYSGSYNDRASVRKRRRFGKSKCNPIPETETLLNFTDMLPLSSCMKLNSTQTEKVNKKTVKRKLKGLQKNAMLPPTPSQSSHLSLTSKSSSTRVKESRRTVPSSNCSVFIADSKENARIEQRKLSNKALHNTSNASNSCHLMEDEASITSSIGKSYCSKENASIISHASAETVTGAGMDALATQDAGSYQFLLDDCLYSSSTILSSFENKGNPDNIFHSHTNITADAACDLAVILSSKKTRVVLFNHVGRMDNIGTARSGNGCSENRDSYAMSKDDGLVSILNTFAYVPQSDKLFSPIQNCICLNGVTNEKTKDWTGVTTVNTPECGQSKEVGSGVDTSEIIISTEPKSCVKVSTSVTEHDLFYMEALTLVMHFLSLDCNNDEKNSASSTSTAARFLQKKILSNKHAMCGIAKLVMVDTTVSRILDAQSSLINKDNESIIISTNSSITLESNKINDMERVLITKKIISGDPTKRGRNKKRRVLSKSDESVTSPKNIVNNKNLDNCKASESHTEVTQSPHNLQACTPTPPLTNKIFERTTKESNTKLFNFHSGDNSSTELMKPHQRKKGHHRKKGNLKFRQKLMKVWTRMQQCEVTIKNEITLASTNTQPSTYCEYCQQSGGLNGNQSSCPNSTPNEIPVGGIALNALNRILNWQLKEDDQHTNGNEDIVEEEEFEIESSKSQSKTDCEMHETNDMRNPLLFKNIMLKKSGALPFLVRAMVETLQAVICLASNESVKTDYLTLSNNHLKNKDTRRYCIICLQHLQCRLQTLSSVIDGACCLNEDNRNIICGIGSNLASSGSEVGILIPSLILVLTRINIVPSTLEDDNDSYDGIMANISLSAIRTLTSITHENETAALQLLHKYDMRQPNLLILNEDVIGISIVLHLLHKLVSLQQQMKCSLLKRQIKGAVTYNVDKDKRLHHCYDAIIFCLNILANILETTSSFDAKKAIFETKVSLNNNHEQDKELALSWLARWVVSQTRPYRDAVMTGSFGKKKKKEFMNEEVSRDLEKHEDEYLVTAGNGFILLACLMRVTAVSDETESNDTYILKEEKVLTQHIRDVIFSQMPKDDLGNCTGKTLVINTLKAFCNFYHYSVGELSVAIVNPVLKLIKGIEEL